MNCAVCLCCTIVAKGILEIKKGEKGSLHYTCRELLIFVSSLPQYIFYVKKIRTSESHACYCALWPAQRGKSAASFFGILGSGFGLKKPKTPTPLSLVLQLAGSTGWVALATDLCVSLSLSASHGTQQSLQARNAVRPCCGQYFRVSWTAFLPSCTERYMLTHRRLPLERRAKHLRMRARLTTARAIAVIPRLAEWLLRWGSA